MKSQNTTALSVIEMLREDHQKVKHLFDEFENAKASAEKQEIVDTAIEELVIHSKLEEELVYPAIRSKIDDDDLMDEALEEHHVVHMLISELKKMKPKDDHFDAKFTVLAENVKHHIKEEETEMLPKAKEINIDWENLKMQVMKRKEELKAKGASKDRGPKKVTLARGAD